jgi:putative ABC transport system substrate-binding protein
MRRRDFIAAIGSTVAGSAAAWPRAARAQQRERVRRVGLLTIASESDPLMQALVVRFREELAKLGWVEGRNLRIDYRFATSDPGRLAAYAEELVNLRPDVIFALAGPAARAVQQRTRVIPIVFSGGGDAVDNGYVNSVARPSGNMTGFANEFTSQGSKWLELLKEAVPRITRVAFVFDPETVAPGPLRAVIDAAAPQLGITIVAIPLRSPVDIERDISAFAAEPAGAMLVIGVPNLARMEAFGRLALQYRLPMMYGGGAFVEDGLLMSQGPDGPERIRGISSYIDHILRGAKPSDLPVQYPTRFELVVNLKVAKAIGVTIAETFLVRADKVIE